MHELTPGVERAMAAAVARAGGRGQTHPTPADVVVGLLAEDEGRPAVLVERLARDVAAVRQAVAALSADEVGPATPPAALFASARAWSLAHRADPAFLTDALLVAALGIDSGFGRAAARVGLDPAAVVRLLADPDGPVVPAEAAASTFVLPDETADRDAARVLDANFNRGREALRVVEDYCRFVLDDRFLTNQAKELRHDLAAAADRLPSGLLLAARDTVGDVGTGVTAAGEYDRRSVADVATANLKRVQEAVRSLEEFGKLFGADLGRDLESIRYRSYTLERAVVRGAGSREKLANARVYVLLTGAECAAALDWTIAQAAAGGATMFQLREKSLPDRELVARARDVRRWTRAAGVLFVVNDRPDIARLSDADGVHLGQDDLPAREARRILGPDALIGVSTHSVEQVRRAVLDGADYLGVGPTFPSRTKAFESFPGVEFVRQATAETSLPAFVLGGVGPSNVGQVVIAGGRRVAVASAVCQADDPEAVVRAIRAALDG